MGILLDILVILIGVLCIVIGVRKGFLRTAAIALCVLLSIVLSGVLSRPMAQAVYTDSVEPTIRAAITEGIKSVGNDSLDEGLGHIEGFLPNFLNRFLSDGGKSLNESLVDHYGDDLVDGLMENAVEPLYVPFLQIVWLTVLFCILLAALGAIRRACEPRLAVADDNAKNRSFGWLGGLILGILWVVVAATVIGLMAFFSIGGFTADTIDRSLLIRAINGINPLIAPYSSLL